MQAPEREPIEGALRGFLTREGEALGIAAAYLFGSVARRTAGPRSDVDVAVLYEQGPPPGLGRFRLEGELEDLLGRPVQLVVLDQASPDLVHRVLRDGVLLLERDRCRRIDFEVRSRAEYFDLEPLRRLYRRQEKTPT
jgi:uncharacterized protein